MRLLSYFPIASEIMTLVLGTSPYVVEWNTTHSYGPDGPWPVVTVQVGTDEDGDFLSLVDLHPGGIYESMLLTTSFCSSPSSPDPCLAQQAGLYQKANSTSVLQHISDRPGLIWQWGSGSAFNLSGQADEVLDRMAIDTMQETVVIHNSTISAIYSDRITQPGGDTYSIRAGSLSLGAPGNGSQIFQNGSRGDNFPGILRASNVTASNSCGLHYGSVTLGQIGSLIWGGYDQSRVLGDVGTFDFGENNAMASRLLDVQIGTENGSSPIDADLSKSLLNSSTTSDGVQPAIINPIVPYFFMSPETCSAITENLPVTLQPDIGLYTWNTGDPEYQKIVKSSAYLAFIFWHTEVQHITIKVPFQLLNLTLEPPIVPKSRPYFPCRPFISPQGVYFLGRAFLQAAYIGINWEANKWFLGQAPGPGMRASNIRSIEPNDSSIDSDPIADFARTWEKSWSVLSETNKSTVAPSNIPTASSSPTVRPAPNLSSGAKAGLGVGTTAGVLGFVGAAMLTFYYIRKKDARQENKNVPEVPDLQLHEKDTLPHHEVGQGIPHEAGLANEIYEI